jgi:hypothetical protein
MPPYTFDKCTNTITFNIKFSDLGICEDDVDPLKRFTFIRVPSLERLYEQYVELEQHEDIAVRAIVAHYACSKAKCVHCGMDASIMCSGFGPTMDSGRKWAKLLCANCGSVYEIKSVKGKAKLSLIQNKGII